MTHLDLLSAIENSKVFTTPKSEKVQVLSRTEHGESWRYTISVDGVEYSDYSRRRITTLLIGKSVTRTSTRTGSKTIQVIDTEDEFIRLRVTKIEDSFRAILDSACTSEEMRAQLLAIKAVQVAQTIEQAKADWAMQAEVRKQLASAEDKYAGMQKEMIKHIKAGEFDSLDIDGIKAALANVKILKAKL